MPTTAALILDLSVKKLPLLLLLLLLLFSKAAFVFFSFFLLFYFASVPRGPASSLPAFLADGLPRRLPAARSPRHGAGFPRNSSSGSIFDDVRGLRFDPCRPSSAFGRRARSLITGLKSDGQRSSNRRQTTTDDDNDDNDDATRRKVDGYDKPITEHSAATCPHIALGSPLQFQGSERSPAENEIATATAEIRAIGAISASAAAATAITTTAAVAVAVVVLDKVKVAMVVVLLSVEIATVVKIVIAADC